MPAKEMTGFLIFFPNMGSIFPIPKTFVILRIYLELPKNHSKKLLKQITKSPKKGIGSNIWEKLPNNLQAYLSCSIFPCSLIIGADKEISGCFSQSIARSYDMTRPKFKKVFSRNASLGSKRNVPSWPLPFSDNFFSGISRKFSLGGNLIFPKTRDEYVPSLSPTCQRHCSKPNLKSLEDKLGEDDQLRYLSR